MIAVSQPSLAPLSELLPYLEQLWKTGILTHNGPLLRELESKLASKLGVPDVVCVSSGACAIQLALAALDIEDGEVITTPFTFVATASIIRWQRCRPIFVDIEPGAWNMDPAKIEAAITPRTRAILPVHVFSAPCQIEAIEEIGRRHGLSVVYDAAHAMTVNHSGKSVLLYGDVSCLSFHATKLFNTAEGGACVTTNPNLAKRIRRMRFFGFDETKQIMDEGMNGKMTEIAAALGLANLPHLDRVRANRRQKYNLYVHLLRGQDEISFQNFNPEEYNFSYMPILFDADEVVTQVESHLRSKGILPRRYFTPSLNTVEIFGDSSLKYCYLPISERIASTVLCLPLYDSLAEEQIRRIAALIIEALRTLRRD